jgi:hypothetical protein
MTVNPRSVWIKLRLGNVGKIIQVIDAGTTMGKAVDKKCHKFLKEVSNTNYGYTDIVRSPATFTGSPKLYTLEALRQEELDFEIAIASLAVNKKEKFFYTLENLLLLNYESRIPGWSIDSCRSVLVLTPQGNFRIFRSHRWKSIGDI